MLAPGDRAARLAEAEAALHRLLTTGGLVRIRHEGEGEMHYGPMDAARLRAYIAELRGPQISTIRIFSSKGL